MTLRGSLRYGKNIPAALLTITVAGGLTGIAGRATAQPAAIAGPVSPGAGGSPGKANEPGGYARIRDHTVSGDFWGWRTEAFAGGITGLITVIGMLVLGRSYGVRRRTATAARADDMSASGPDAGKSMPPAGGPVWLTGSLGQEPDKDEGPILAAGRIAELRANIPHAELAGMAEECIDNLHFHLSALRHSLIAGVPRAIAMEAHAMVGVACGYGMVALEARLRAILTAARGNRLDTVEAGAAAMVEADLKRASAALRRAMRVGEPAG